MSKQQNKKIPTFVLKKIIGAVESPSKDGTNVPVTAGVSVTCPKFDGFETNYIVTRDDRGVFNHRLEARYENPPEFWRKTKVKPAVMSD